MKEKFKKKNHSRKVQLLKHEKYGCLSNYYNI